MPLWFLFFLNFLKNTIFVFFKYCTYSLNLVFLECFSKKKKIKHICFPEQKTVFKNPKLPDPNSLETINWFKSNTHLFLPLSNHSKFIMKSDNTFMGFLSSFLFFIIGKMPRT